MNNKSRLSDQDIKLLSFNDPTQLAIHCQKVAEEAKVVTNNIIKELNSQRIKQSIIRPA